MLDATVYMLG